jgi:hypothetical protein
MPAIRFPDVHGLAQGLKDASHVVLRREVDHTVPETIAVRMYLLLVSISLVFADISCTSYRDLCEHGFRDVLGDCQTRVVRLGAREITQGMITAL